MQKFIVVAFLICILTACGDSSAAILVQSDNGQYSAAYSTLSAACSAAGVKRIEVTSPQTISTGFTCAGRSVEIKQGGLLTIAAGQTLTINGPFTSGPYQVFSGEGTVTGTGVKERRLEWWGAKSDGTTDCGPAAAKAMAAGPGTIRAGNGTYLFNSIQEGSYYLWKSKTGISVIGEGPGTIFKAGNGLRTTSTGLAILYNHTEPISDVVYKDFTVDFNGQNNLLLSSYGSTANINRMGGAAGGSHNRVNHVNFKNSAGHHFLFFDGGFSDIDISHNAFSECGLSIAGNETTDHSSIYIKTDGGSVSDNLFYNSTQDNIATAIEIHGNNVVATNNKIDKYGTGVNIAGDDASASGIIVTSNAMNLVRTGVVLWTLNPYTINNLSLQGNKINLYDSEQAGIYPPGSGILYTGTVDTSTNLSKNWNLSKNVITLDNPYTGSFTWPITGMDLDPVENLTITGENISGMKGEAIRIEAVSGKAHNGLTIADNSIKSCGYTSASGRNTAIKLLSLDSNPTSNVVVRGNTIVSGHYGSATDMAYGIGFNTQQFSNVRVADNIISGATTFDMQTPTDQTTGIFQINHSSSITGNPVGLIRSTLGGNWYDSVAKRQYFANVLGSNGTSGIWRSIEYLTAAPTTGQHYVGDRWVNTSPAVGQPKGGFCTVLGDPGTFASEGNL